MSTQHPLKRYLDASQIKAVELAEKVGTSRQTIHRVITGSQTPSLDLVRRLIIATDGAVSADDFISRERAA